MRGLILIGQLLLILMLSILVAWLLIVAKRKLFNSRKTGSRLILIAFVLFFYMGFPVVISAIITNKWYLDFCFESTLGEKDWFSFLGSYIGITGTLLFGWVAYWQTELINKQNQQAADQQKQIDQLKNIVTEYQACPMVEFGKFTFEVYVDPAKPAWLEQKIENIFFTQFGSEHIVHGKNFVILTLKMRQQGVIPITECVIEKINWKIAGIVYEINLDKSKNKMSWANRISIVIEERDFGNKAGVADSFFKAVSRHNTYDQHGSVRFDKSELELSLVFSNEFGEKRRYCITYRIQIGKKLNTTTKKVNKIIDIGIPHIKMEKIDGNG